MYQKNYFLIGVLALLFVGCTSAASQQASLVEPIEQRAKKQIALTFDDGPHKEYTAQILDSLKEYNAKATFYVLGQRVASNSGLILRMQHEGHQIGNHTWSHYRLTKISDQEITTELENTSAAVYAITGTLPNTVRPPRGAFSHHSNEMTNMPVILWSIDPQDWLYRNENAIYNWVTTHTETGSIILLHDIYKSTADSVPMLLSALSDDGYEFVTINELLGFEDDPSLAVPGTVFRTGGSKSQEECYEPAITYPLSIQNQELILE